MGRDVEDREVARWGLKNGSGGHWTIYSYFVKRCVRNITSVGYAKVKQTIVE
jgi:hypothetical protein